jgi:acetyl esterase/lipase
MIRIISVLPLGSNLPTKLAMNIRKLLIPIFSAILLMAPSLARGDAPAVEVRRGLTYVERPSGKLECDVYMPQGKGPFPGMLIVHGGAWRVGSRAQLAAIANEFAMHGYTAVAISYRLAPQDKFPAQIHDCQAAVRWMRSHSKELKIDADRIGGFGYSAGGHLVALLGTLTDDDLREKDLPKNAPSAKLQVVLAGGAPCDFRVMPPNSEQIAYWLGGSRAAKPDSYRDASPAAYIKSNDPPMFFFHGENDILVPIASPMRMVSLLKEAGDTAELYTCKGEGHVQAVFDRGALERALAFADQRLKGEKALAAGPQAEKASAAKPGPEEESSTSRTGGGN